MPTQNLPSPPWSDAIPAASTTASAPAMLCLVFFVAGALLPLPGYLVLAGLWVRGIQASLLLGSLVCLLAASSPWWVDWLEDRRTEAVLRERAAVPYGWTSTDLPEDFRKENKR
jgi:hypothetical protein